MPTPRSVQDIKTRLLNPALTSHFEIQLFPPTGSTGYPFDKFLADNKLTYGSDDQISLQLMCSEATLPGSSLATHEINNDFTGVTERHVYRRLYDDRIDLTFYVDAAKYYTIRFFEVWMKFIVNETVSRGQTGKPGSPDPNYFYRMKYISEYSSSMTITKFERSYNGVKLDYNFVNIFPISISSMPVSYDSSSLLKCTVSMSYIRYYITQALGGEPATVSGETTPLQQAQFNASNLTVPGLEGTAALAAPVNRFNIGGIPQSAANASGNTVSGFTVGANANIA